MRVWILTVSLVMMLSVVAACGDDEGDGSESADADTVSEVSDDETSTPEPEPTATEEPDPTPEPEATATPTQETTDAAEESEQDDADESENQDQDAASEGQEDSGSEGSGNLDHLLLSLEDLQGDWTETDTGFADDAEVGDLTDDPFEAPCGIEPIDEAITPVDEAQRVFQGTEMGPFFSHGVLQHSSSDDASSSLDHIRTLFECDEWIETDEMGEEIVFEINESDIGDVGDESVSVRVAFNLGEQPEMEMDMFGDIGFDLVFFRRGEYISSLMFFDIFGMSEVDFPGLVQLADEKLSSGT